MKRQTQHMAAIEHGEVRRPAKEVVTEAFKALENTPLMSAMKAAGEYEKLFRGVKLPPVPTQTSHMTKELLSK